MTNIAQGGFDGRANAFAEANATVEGLLVAKPLLLLKLVHM